MNCFQWGEIDKYILLHVYSSFVGWFFFNWNYVSPLKTTKIFFYFPHNTDGGSGFQYINNTFETIFHYFWNKMFFGKCLGILALSTILTLNSIYSTSNFTDKNFKMYSKLLSSTNYDPRMKPSSNVEIKVSLSLKQIVSLDEKSQLMISNSFLSIEWQDPRLAWNPLDNDNLTRCLVPTSSIWVVDLFVINSVSDGYVRIPPQSLAHVNYDGRVYVVLSLSSLTTRCKVNVKHYPFDTQKCSVIFYD